MTEREPEIGSYLQNHRRAQNISLEAVSRLTRISLTSLRHIENEEWDSLPAPAFVKGFLRSFAEAIGIDPAEVLRRYDLNCQIRIQHARGRNQAQSGARFWWRIVLSAICLLSVIVGTVYVFNWRERSAAVAVAFSRGGATETAPDDPLGAIPGAAQTQADKGNPAETQIEPPQVSGISKELTLLVSAVAATRLKVIADARKPELFDLKPGDELSLKAESHFSLLIDNAAGVRLSFNGQAIALPSKSGQPLTLQLP